MDNPKVVELETRDRAKECSDALQDALEQDFDEIYILGFNKDDEYVRYSNGLTLRDQLYLLTMALELTKREMIDEE